MQDSQAVYQTLRSVFGFGSFRPGQEAVVEQLMEGRSALAVFPTGSGKSLCYQLSALLLDGLTVVVSPLIALMKDQIDFLHKRGISAARLDSSVSLEEFRRIDAALGEGRLRLLYVAPERFSNERFIHKMRRLKIALMVIDEAHCISEWGHNFRPDYMKLTRTARSLGVKRVLALTATATPGVAGDICREFNIAPEGLILTGFYRPNLELRASACRPGTRVKALLERLESRPRGATIVYTTLQHTAETVAAALLENEFPAKAYHAGMKSDERAAVQDWFMGSADAIVVATIAFGMGIDKADIRYVYHYNLPKSLEGYSQEIGRAGRDGASSLCEILASPDDVTVLENFTYGDTPDAESIGYIVEEVLNGAETFDVSTYELSQKSDMRLLVVSTLLTYLELADVIESTSPFYSQYQFMPLRSSQEIVARFDPERAEFLKGIFACAVKAKKWFDIDIEETARRLNTTRERVTKAFNYLEEQGDLELKVAGIRQGYRMKSRPGDGKALKAMLTERFATRERNDIARVRQVIELLQNPGCIVRRLLAYFGEEMERDCGHCGPCLGESPLQVRATKPDPAAGPLMDWAKLESLRRTHTSILATPRQAARFLCGLTTPRLTRAKLSKHPLFGSLRDMPFRSVIEAVTQQFRKS